jgi:putative transposase
MIFHGKDLRKGRLSETERIYHITTTTFQRRPLFSQFTEARIVIDAIRSEEENGQAATLAYVLMPDHLHWLMQLNSGALSDVVGRVKSITAHRIGRQVWQRGFYDHALRSDEDVMSVARYIIANPVRAGLVDRVGDYPYWDAIWLEGGR